MAYFDVCSIFSAVIQDYESDVGLEYVLLGNDVLLKCKTPGFVGDFVSIVSWVVDDEDTTLDRGKESSIVTTAHCSQGNLEQLITNTLLLSLDFTTNRVT